ncbi:MAG: hypothetical protein SPL71_12295, partial [Oribacterium sp.]|nr:hypothetical protein [Oribacterium sp.]
NTPEQDEGGDDFSGTMNSLDERNSFPCETSAWFVKHVLEPDIHVMERENGKGKENEQGGCCGLAGAGLQKSFDSVRDVTAAE